MPGKVVQLHLQKTIIKRSKGDQRACLERLLPPKAQAKAAASTVPSTATQAPFLGAIKGDAVGGTEVGRGCVHGEGRAQESQLAPLTSAWRSSARFLTWLEAMRSLLEAAVSNSTLFEDIEDVLCLPHPNRKPPATSGF